MLHDLIFRVRTLFARRHADDDLDDELRFHLERQIEKHVRAGMSPAEASRRARIELGGLAQAREATRASWGVGGFLSLQRDAALALRGLRRSPVLAATVVLTLALGIGASTAIFTLMDAVLWHLLPVRSPQTLLRVTNRSGPTPGPVTGFEYSAYRLLLDNSPGADLAGYATAPVNLDVDGSPESTVQGQLVTGGYFSLLGVEPTVGRSLGPDDDRWPDGRPTLMLSYAYWQRRFAGDPGAIGRTVHVSGQPFTIVGVAPQGFFGAEIGTTVDVFLPITTQPVVMPAFENLLEQPIVRRGWVRILARIRDGSTRERASARMTTLLRAALPADLPKGQGSPGLDEVRIALRPAAEISELRARAMGPLTILMGTVGILLLIACANAANLLLARASSRQSEFAVRLALGASRGRLIRQLLVESTLLAGLGGALGMLLAGWGTRALAAFLSIGRPPLALDLDPNARILAFTMAVSIVTGVLFGLTPAVRASRLDLTPALRRTGGLPAGRGGLQPGRLLAGTQVVLSLLLLAGAGLFVRSLQRLSIEDAVVPPDQVLVMRVEPRGSDQRGVPGTSERLDRLYRQLIERVERIPGVQSASLANSSPAAPTSSAGARLDTPSGGRIAVPLLMAYPGYFATVGTGLVAGRDFDSGDLGDGSPRVCIINETLADELFPGVDATGRICFTRRREVAGRTVEEQYRIVGVVQDSRYTNPLGDAPPVIYMPFLQTPTGRGQMVLHVRTAPAAGGVPRAVLAAVAALDPAVPLFELHTLGEEMDAALVQQRFVAILSGVFGAAALLLASVGLYGLLAFRVVSRTGELAVRLALGAGPGRLVWLVARDALVVVGGAVAVALPPALGVIVVMPRLVPGLVFGLDAADLVTVAAATLSLLLLVALAAALAPAARAARLDPLVALRAE